MKDPVELRILGNSDLKVTPVGLGCWQFSKRANLAGRFWPWLKDDVILEIVRTSIDGGINWFDTAEIYGQGASERSLARSLESIGINPGEVFIATKWWPMFRTASSIRRTIDKRQASLQPYPIDLYQVHQPYSFSSAAREMEAMSALVRDKRIKYVGVSNFSARKMKNAWESLQQSGISLVSNQVSFNLLNRRIETNGILDTARELGISIIAYSPLHQGLVTGKFHENPQLLKKIGFRKYSPMFSSRGLQKSRQVIELVKKLAEKYRVTPSQIALNWVIHFHGEAVVAIPGATEARQAGENAGAMLFRLSAADMKLLDEASRGFRQ